MIGTPAEYQKVRQLAAVLSEALRLINARHIQLDPAWRGFLRTTYLEQLSELERELHQFERSRGMVQRTGASLREEVRLAERQIKDARHDMFLLRERMQDLDPSTLQDCDRLALLDAQLQTHEDLLVQWLAYKAELLAMLGGTGIRLHADTPPFKPGATAD